MRIAQRAQAVAPFFAMEFGKHAAALEAAGHDIVKLNIGEPDFGAPPPVLARMHATLEAKQFPYTAALGLPALREAIAGFYRQQHGVAVDPHRVIVTAGASAALLLLTAALVDPGDEVLVGDPSYPCNRHFLAGFGADVRLVATDASSRYQLDLARVRDHWSARTRGLMLATPSNPTGTSVPPAELEALCAWARQHDAWRLVDEIYLNLSDHGPDGRPAQTVLAHDPDAIVINSFSKFFGMTGWRLGWCVVPEVLVPVVERLAQNFYICASTLAQHAALACFTPESLAICEARRQTLLARRCLVLDRLAEMGLSVPVPPNGAFYVYIDVGATGLDAATFCERVLQEAHVALTPGKDFGPRSANTHVRLSYASSIDTLRTGMDRLAGFMAELRSPDPIDALSAAPS